MLSPTYLRNVSERARRIAEEMEDEIVFVIVLLLLSGREYDAPYVYERVIEAMRAYEAAGSAEMQKAIRRTLREIESDIGANFARADSLTDYEREVIRHYNQITQETWHNLTQTQAYAAVNDYVSAVDRGALRVAMGEAHDKVWKSEARAFGRHGMPVTTADGRTEQASTAIERNLRTAVSRLAGDLELASAERNGFEYVLVSAHLGARPTHEVWQGKIYSLHGEKNGYEDFKTATGYGDMLGLCGINCRHSFSPWKEGMPNPYEDFDNEESRKRYEIEQQQRALERKVRAIRRRVKEAEAECEARPDDPECAQRLKALKADLRDARREYKEFCAAHDLRPLEERLKD